MIDGVILKTTLVFRAGVRVEIEARNLLAVLVQNFEVPDILMPDRHAIGLSNTDAEQFADEGEHSVEDFFQWEVRPELLVGVIESVFA